MRAWRDDSFNMLVVEYLWYDKYISLQHLEQWSSVYRCCSPMITSGLPPTKTSSIKLLLLLTPPPKQTIHLCQYSARLPLQPHCVIVFPLRRCPRALNITKMLIRWAHPKIYFLTRVGQWDLSVVRSAPTMVHRNIILRDICEYTRAKGLTAVAIVGRALWIRTI